MLTEKYPAKLIRMGIKDRFGKSGSAKELLKYFELTAEAIIQNVITSKEWERWTYRIWIYVKSYLILWKCNDWLERNN